MSASTEVSFAQIRKCSNKRFFPDFGTGKTLLLVHKATELLKAGETVLFIISSEENMDIPLTLTLKDTFGRVIKENGLDKELLELKQIPHSNLLEAFTSNIGSRHVFADEIIMAYNKDGHVIQELDKWISSVSKTDLNLFFWLARDSQYSGASETPCTALEKRFRNEKNIIDYLKDVECKVASENCPVEAVFHDILDESEVNNSAVKYALLKAEKKVSKRLWVILDMNVYHP